MRSPVVLGFTPLDRVLANLETVVEQLPYNTCGREAAVVAQGGKGRDHNPLGFLYWLAGGGVKGGHSHGESDPLGHRAVGDRHHIRDLHATILHLLGLDHRKLTYFYGGLDHKLTGVREAHVIHDVIA